MTILSSGTSALMAFQRALNTIGHNVANAGTAGYSRQRVDLLARPGQSHGYGFIGAGVQVGSVTRMADNFNFMRVLDSSSEYSRLDALASMSARMDDTLSDTATGPQAAWSTFFDSMQGIVSQPASTASRQEMLSSANALAARLRSLDAQFDTMGNEVEGKLRAGVNEVNRLTTQISQLNNEILRQRGAAGGQTPNDLLDQRDRLVEELSGHLGVTSALQDDGTMNVYAGSGQALVVGAQSMKLTTVPDPFRPERSEIALQTPGGSVRLGNNLGGELGGLLEFRTQVLDAGAAQLGRAAATLVFQTNAQHRQGVDLYGNPGGDIYQPITATGRPAANNTGSGAISGTLADPSAFTGRDVTLSFDGANWSAMDTATGEAVPVTGTGAPGNPLMVGGMAVSVSGAPAAGDRFLMQPAANAAGQMRVAITDPSQIAAAGPLTASGGLTNLGNATIGGMQIANPNAPGFGTPAAIVFTDANNYTIDGNGPFPYDASTGISGPGWTLTLDGTPAAGDTFNVGPTPPGSSDNANMRLLGAIDDLPLLDGGNVSMNAALGQATVGIASQARQSGLARDAQGAITQGALSARDAVSGVNLDEEAANMLRYQQAYQAAAQVISTADQMFQSLMAAVRR